LACTRSSTYVLYPRGDPSGLHRRRFEIHRSGGRAIGVLASAHRGPRTAAGRHASRARRRRHRRWIGSAQCRSPNDCLRCSRAAIRSTDWRT